VSREDDEEKLWNWLRKTYPPEDKTFDWIAVISPFRVEERKELRLVNQKPVRIRDARVRGRWAFEDVSVERFDATPTFRRFWD
jgi:hypothetical protein